MSTPSNMPFEIVTREFEYNGDHYKVALAPELYPEEDELDFTGNYAVVLISSKSGTKSFELMVDPHTKWQSEPNGMDPGLIDALDKIITEIRRD